MLPKESKAERIKILSDSAYKISNEYYSKKLTEDELTQKRREYSEQAVKLEELDKELTESKEWHKSQVKPIKTNMNSDLFQIKTGYKEVQEDLYLIDDQEEGIMGYYNGEGELVKQRPLTKEERQLSIQFKQAE